MDMEEVFHMNGGIGKSTSVAQNFSLQKKEPDAVKRIIVETIQEVYLSTTPKTLGMADFGCSSGSSIFSIIKDILDAVESISLKILHCPAPEFCVYLNDLPTNDFNSIFKILPEFQKMLSQERKGRCPSIFMGGYPGSFYGRLFPNNSLHFVHSSYSLHWLSRVPPAIYDEQGKPLDKSSISISESSPPLVSQAYCKQFQEDFSLFLRSRSEELVVGGRMVLIFLGRFATDHADRGNSFFWEPLSRSFAILVSKGEIEKEKVDSYDVHFYAPSREEIEAAVKKEGSFVLEKQEVLELEKEQTGSDSYGTKVAKTGRSVQASMVSDHFGQEILDSLFDNYARLMDEAMAKEDTNPITFAIVVRRI